VRTREDSSSPTQLQKRAARVAEQEIKNKGAKRSARQLTDLPTSQYVVGIVCLLPRSCEVAVKEERIIVPARPLVRVVTKL